MKYFLFLLAISAANAGWAAERQQTFNVEATNVPLDAYVYVNGDQTPQTGSTRLFTFTGVLDDSKNYSYDVAVMAWREGNWTQLHRQNVAVTDGQIVRVTCPQPVTAPLNCDSRGSCYAVTTRGGAPCTSGANCNGGYVTYEGGSCQGGSCGGGSCGGRGGRFRGGRGGRCR